MSTIVEKLNYLNETKLQIKNAIEDQGVSVPAGASFRSYAKRIRQITTPSEEHFTWEPDSNWWDIQTILAEDPEDYPAKMIVLLDNSLNTFNLKGAVKYKTNEGSEFDAKSATTDCSVVFNGNDDKQSSIGNKTRYVIYYFQTQDVSTLTIPSTSLYVILSDITLGVLTTFKNNKHVECVKFIGDSSIKGTSLAEFFSGCSALITFQLPDTSAITNFNYMCNECNSLVEFTPEMCKTTSYPETAAQKQRMFYNCYNLRKIVMDLNNYPPYPSVIAEWMYRCSELKHLEFTHAPTLTLNQLATGYTYSNGTNYLVFPTLEVFSTDGLLNENDYHYGAERIEKLIFTGDKQLSVGAGSRYPSVEEIVNNTSFPLKLASFNNANSRCTKFTGEFIVTNNGTFSDPLPYETIVQLLNALDPSSANRTLTLGAHNLNKLSPEDKLIATQKAWALA